MIKEMMTQKGAAKFLGIHPETLRNYTNKGMIKSQKRGATRLYEVGDVEELKGKICEPIQEKVSEPEIVKEDIDINEILKFSLTEEQKKRRHSREESLKVLNQEPPKNWLKQVDGELKSNGEPVMDLPIDKVEFLLNYIFGGFTTDIIEVKQLFKSSVSVTARLRYTDLDGVNRCTDGVGAVFIAREEDVQKMVPVAYALAKKNAAKGIGVIFGSNINRDVVAVKGKRTESVLVVDLKSKINSAHNWEELDRLKSEVLNSGSKELIRLYNEREFKLS